MKDLLKSAGSIAALIQGVLALDHLLNKHQRVDVCLFCIILR